MDLKIKHRDGFIEGVIYVPNGEGFGEGFIKAEADNPENVCMNPQNYFFRDGRVLPKIQFVLSVDNETISTSETAIIFIQGAGGFSGSVSILLNDQVVPVEITDGSGGISFDAESEGTYSFRVGDPDKISNIVEVIVS